MIALVIPGNSYPITEVPHLPDGKSNPKGFLGKACQAGYQSHFTIVKGEDISNAFPVETPDFDPATVADELVVFETAQTLPLFVFYA